MQLQLRPSAPRFHPLMKPMYRRAGFAGLGLTPGYTPAQQAMADAYLAQTGGGGGGAVYVAPPTTGAPACSSSPFANISDSPECIAALLAWQQTQFQANNNANFQVFYSDCVAQGLDPSVCASRTYGMTPAGGYTSDAGAGPKGSQLILDANGQPISGVPVYTGPPLPGMPGAGTAPATGSGAPTTPSSLKFTNLTSGNNSKLTVGDRWQIQITGAARNAPVSVKGGQNGAQDTTPMGSSDSSGNWTSNGQITADQIGSWTEAWTVGGQPVGNFAFTVVPASGSPGSGSGSPGTGSGSGQIVSGSFMDLLSKSTTIGGTSIPDWALVGGALVAAYFLFMRGK
jgi:hypothetical protein